MSQFSILKSNIQRDIYELSVEATSINQKKCTDEVSECNVQMFNECEGIGEQFCLNLYPKLNECPNDGMMISKRSGIIFPIRFNMTTLTPDQKLFICASKQLETYFAAIKVKYLNKINRVYMGTYFDYFIAYPGQKRNCTSQYLASKRKWYLQATTGSKNIIFIIDISSSIYLEQMKAAVIKAINVLSFNDFLAVVIMKGTSQILIQSQISRATEQMKHTLAKSVEYLQPDPTANQTSYEQAFRLALKLLNDSSADSYGAPCKHSSNIVLILTNQPPNLGLKTVAGLSQLINDWNSQLKIKLFTYGFGDNINLGLLKQLSCLYEGDSFGYSFQNKSNVQNDIMAYLKFLSVTVNNNDVIWTEPYRDAVTNKLTITCSVPVYSYEGARRYKIGVIATDVLMQIVESDTISSEQILKQFLKCPTEPVVMDQCTIEGQRANNSRCFQNCRYQHSSSVCSKDPKLNNFFAHKFQKNTAFNRCCPDNSFPLALVLSVLILILFALVSYTGLWLRNRSSHSNTTIQSTNKSSESLTQRNLVQNKSSEKNAAKVKENS